MWHDVLLFIGKAYIVLLACVIIATIASVTARRLYIRKYPTSDVRITIERAKMLYEREEES